MPSPPTPSTSGCAPCHGSSPPSALCPFLTPPEPTSGPAPSEDPASSWGRGAEGLRLRSGSGCVFPSLQGIWTPLGMWALVFSSLPRVQAPCHVQRPDRLGSPSDVHTGCEWTCPARCLRLVAAGGSGWASLGLDPTRTRSQQGLGSPAAPLAGACSMLGADVTSQYLLGGARWPFPSGPIQTHDVTARLVSCFFRTIPSSRRRSSIPCRTWSVLCK